MSFYAVGNYSQAEHKEDILVSEEFYNKIKSQVEEADYIITELDGKYSEVSADLDVNYYSEEDVKNWAVSDVVCDCFDACWYVVDSICDSLGLNLAEECNRVVEWCKSVAKDRVNVTCSIPSSKVDELNAFVAKLCEEDE